MDILRLPAVLENCERILVSGAGCGFDIYAGLPIYARLRALGKQVHLANLSFAALRRTNAKSLTSAVYRVGPADIGEDSYFPERTLARFLSRGDEDVPVYAFERAGVEPVQEGYAHLVRELRLDAIVLVDGGTDILLRGDEVSLGTPAEDMTSLAAVAALEVPTRIVVCLGFGLDAYHGVCHANWLENVAALTATQGFLGATALLQRMPEVRLYVDAVNDADRTHSMRPSIVNGSIAAAIDGKFGDYHRSMRTSASKLFVNPLMTLLWAFDLPAIARQNLYLDRLKATRTISDVELAIEGFHATARYRSAQPIPL